MGDVKDFYGLSKYFFLAFLDDSLYVHKVLSSELPIILVRAEIIDRG
jgi:hypothetical protein